MKLLIILRSCRAVISLSILILNAELFEERGR